jgi:HemY protein
MMRTWFWTVLLVVLAVVVAFVIHRFPGNVLIVLDQWRIQVSLAFATVLVITTFVCLYVLIRVLIWLGHMPERYSNWRGQRQEKREQSLLEDGWTALLEGRYPFAEKTLTQLSSKSTNTRRQVLALLSAARAAHAVGDYKRQDTLLKQAQDAVSTRVGDLELGTAVAAAAADLWLDQGRAQDALAALQADRVRAMDHVHTMRLLLRAYHQTASHAKVIELARILKRKESISKEQAEQMIEAAAAAIIGAEAQSTSWQACWKDLKPEERALPEVALVAAQRLQQEGNLAESTKVLEVALNNCLAVGSLTSQSSTKLLAAYSRAEPQQVTPRLQKAEQWLEATRDASSTQTADLLTALGALCLAAQMWGQAQRYLERSAKLRKDARVHALLGSLFDRIGQRELAAQHWRLATAVSAALPVLAQDVVLPAANMEADPVFPLGEGLGTTGGYDYGQQAQLRDRGHPVDPVATSSTEYDEFFDSAPVRLAHLESADVQAPVIQSDDKT